MSPQVGVKYAAPRPLGGVLCSLGALVACPPEEGFIISAAPGPLDCAPIGRPDIWRWVAGIRPGLSGRHATRSTRQASGYQQAAIYYSWISGGLQYSRAKPCKDIPCTYRQEQVDWSNKRGPREIRAARQSYIDFAQDSSSLAVNCGPESCLRSAVQGKGSTVDT